MSKHRARQLSKTGATLYAVAALAYVGGMVLLVYVIGKALP